MAARWSRAWSNSAPTRACSKAIVAPSGSCSSSVEPSSRDAAMSLRSSVRAAICAKVRVFSAAKLSAVTADERRAAEQRLADDARAHGHGDHLRAVTGAELARDPGQVALHGQSGEPERLADLLVGAAVGDEPQQLDLAAGELSDR